MGTKRRSAEEKFEAISLYTSGVLPVHVICSQFNCSEATFFRWYAQFDGTIGSLENKSSRPHTPHPNSHTAEEIQNIQQLLQENPYIEIKDLFEKLVKEYKYKRTISGLYHFLRTNNYISEPIPKNKYSTMFDDIAVKNINAKYLATNKDSYGKFIIEINDNGIYIAQEVNGYPCTFTVYYSAALKFDSEKDCQEFMHDLPESSKYKVSIKKLV